MVCCLRQTGPFHLNFQIYSISPNILLIPVWSVVVILSSIPIISHLCSLFTFSVLLEACQRTSFLFHWLSLVFPLLFFCFQLYWFLHLYLLLIFLLLALGLFSASFSTF